MPILTIEERAEVTEIVRYELKEANLATKQDLALAIANIKEIIADFKRDVYVLIEKQNVAIEKQNTEIHKLMRNQTIWLISTIFIVASLIVAAVKLL